MPKLPIVPCHARESWNPCRFNPNMKNPMQNLMSSHVLDAVLRARVIFAIGSRDCGKTTFITKLANELFRQGFSVGVIDSDVGQSDIGPPTTIGFGIVDAELKTLGSVEAQQLYFVGSVTPRGHFPAMLLGSRKLLDHALDCDLQKILIDSTGFISGQDGRILKQQKIQALHPDLLISLQAREECEHILNAYAFLETPEILRLTPSGRCRSKSRPARQEHRRDAFQHYFARARDLRVSLVDIGIFDSNLFTGRPLTTQEQHDIAGLLSDMRAKETGPNEAVADSQMCWGEWIGEELFLITEHALQRSQIFALKSRLPAIRYIHNSSSSDFQNLLLGLLDAQGECCGLGILKSIDFQAKHAIILTPVESGRIAAVQFSSYTV